MTNFDGNQTSQVVCKSERIPARIKILVAMHLLLGMTPAVGIIVFSNSMSIAWLMYVVHTFYNFGFFLSLLSVQTMLLSFWIAMGTSKGIKRLIAGFLGSAYMMMWPSIGILLSQSASYPEESPRVAFLNSFPMICATILISAGIIILILRRSIELHRVSDPEITIAPKRIQFSILHLLMILSIAAVALGLAKNAALDPAPPTVFQIALVYSWYIVFCIISTICLAWAALGTDRLVLRFFAAIIVVILLNIIDLIFKYQSQWELRQEIGASIITIGLVSISLLVVRSCGYRLVPKTPVPN
jgi:hypothetical protein